MQTEMLQQLNLKEPIAIIGAGVVGKSCFDLLHPTYDVTVFDEGDAVSPHFSHLEQHIKQGEFTNESFDEFGTVLISPGIDSRRSCFARVEEKLLTDIELFGRLVTKPVIGVTGSNGKSTVVTLLKDVTTLAGKNYTLCGNIGFAALNALMNEDEACDGYIVELSSYQLERCPSLRIDIGVWLNVSPDHLDRYDSYEHYVATKAKILQQSEHIVANIDDEDIEKYVNPEAENTVFFSQRYQMQWLFTKGTIEDESGNKVFALADFPQIGTHHADNLMAVFAVAEKLRIDRNVTAQACKVFQPLPSRAVVVAKKNGVTYINDSKGTNTGATSAAINGIEQPIILLVGGESKGQDFTELAEIAVGKVKACIIYGVDAASIEVTLSQYIPSHRGDNFNHAFEQACQLATDGDVVMLSPACASFDMFENYLKRGEYFEQLVREKVNE